MSPDDEPNRPTTIKLPGIVDWAPVLSWRIGITDDQTDSLHLTHARDEDTPSFFRAAASGELCPLATLTARKHVNDQLTTAVTVTMEDCVVAAFANYGSADDQVDSITLRFKQLNLSQAASAGADDRQSRLNDGSGG